MRVIFDRDGRVSLEDLETMNRFEAVAECAQSQIDKALEGIGRREGQDHVWIAQEWLRRHGHDTVEWRQGFDAMIAYAASRGWVDSQGAVRAHLAVP